MKHALQKCPPADYRKESPINPAPSCGVFWKVLDKHI
jgi:hypothetical protein